MKEFYEDFIKMQAEFPAVLKKATGQVGQQKIKYADLPEIVETIRPILARHGFAFLQPIESLMSTDGKTYLRTILIHKSGQAYQSDTEVSFQGEDIKKFGAAVTYYRRYALQSILGLVADIDADDLPDPLGKKSKIAEPPHSSEDTMFMKFYDENCDGINANDVKSFLKARSGYNKRSISENINDFISSPEAFHKEFNSWINKQTQKTA